MDGEIFFNTQSLLFTLDKRCFRLNRNKKQKLYELKKEKKNCDTKLWTRNFNYFDAKKRKIFYCFPIHCKKINCQNLTFFVKILRFLQIRESLTKFETFLTNTIFAKNWLFLFNLTIFLKIWQKMSKPKE